MCIFFHYCKYYFLGFFRFFFWEIKEGPEKISVHGRHSRATSSLEAYNCALNKRIRCKGNFFNFCQILVNEEFEKYTTLKLLLQSAGGIAAPATQKRGVSEILLCCVVCSNCR